MTGPTIPSVQLRDVVLDFPIRGRKGARLARTKESAIGGQIQTDDDRRSSHIRALDKVSFDLGPGDRVALIGHNGAGKSTLLRVLAGIYTPNRGSCTVNGRTSCLLNPTLGMSPDASGYESLVVAGTLYGLSRREIEASIEDVLEFTDLGPYLDLPLRSYSTGMRTRLSFAVATLSKPDILLIDEIFNAVDDGFKTKVQQRLLSAVEENGIVVLASHVSELSQTFCNKAMWMAHGTVHRFGTTIDIISAYEASSMSAPIRPQ